MSNALLATFSRRHAKWMIPSAIVLVTFVASCVHNTFIFHHNIFEDSDFAGVSILVNQAAEFHLLVGFASAANLLHPGPDYYYLMAAGQEVFWHTLHIVPGPYNAQLFTTYLMNSVELVMIYGVIRQRLSVPYALLVVGADYAFTAQHSATFVSTWAPYMFVNTFLLFTLTAVAVAIGDLRKLPYFTGSAALLFNAHVTFIFLIPLLLAIVLASLFIHRRRSSMQYPMPSRSTKVIACLVPAVFLLPMVLELIFHWPGPWEAYWQHVVNPAPQPHSPLSGGLLFMARQWPGQAGGFLLVGLGLLAFPLVLRDPDRQRRSWFLGIYVAIGIVELFITWYSLSEVPALSHTYEGFFSWAIPGLLAGVFLVEGIELLNRNTVRLASLRRIPSAAWSVSFGAALLAYSVTLTGFVPYYLGAPYLAGMSHALDAQRDNRIVALELGLPNVPGGDWSKTVGLMLAELRQNVPVCMANPAWVALFTPENLCHLTHSSRVMRVTIYDNNQPIPRSQHVIWTDSTGLALTEP